MSRDSTLKDRLDDIPVPPLLLDPIVRRGQKLRWRRRVAAGLASLVVVAAGSMGALSLADVQERKGNNIGRTSERSRWKPVGPPIFQPVLAGTEGIVRVGVTLIWEGRVEGASPTECQVDVIGEAKDVVGSKTKSVPPPARTPKQGVVPSRDLSIPVRVPPEDMGVDSRVTCQTDSSTEPGN